MKIVILSILTLFLISCANLLPSIQQETETPWKSYSEAKLFFTGIIPTKTTVTNLSIDISKTPNIEILNYLDIMQKFMPNQSIKIEDLDKEIQHCLSVKEGCTGLRISPDVLKNKRYGNVLLDLFNFSKNTKTSGWRFEAILVVIDGVIVYKIFNGVPSISKDERKHTPLGPLQDIKIRVPVIDIGE